MNPSDLLGSLTLRHGNAQCPNALCEWIPASAQSPIAFNGQLQRFTRAELLIGSLPYTGQDAMGLSSQTVGWKDRDNIDQFHWLLSQTSAWHVRANLLFAFQVDG